MTNSRYKTPDAMEMAVKAAAKASSQDTNQALLDYYHDRFLSRIFSEDDPRFILKGGRGMLARLVDVRRTNRAIGVGSASVLLLFWVEQRRYARTWSSILWWILR